MLYFVLFVLHRSLQCILPFNSEFLFLGRDIGNTDQPSIYEEKKIPKFAAIIVQPLFVNSDVSHQHHVQELLIDQRVETLLT